VAGLAFVLAGRTAAILAAAIMSTIPLFLWELGVTYVDMFPAFYGVTCAIAVVLWVRGGSPWWLAIAGALAAFAFASKVPGAAVGVSLAVGLALVGRRPFDLGERLTSVVRFAAGGVVAIPWIIRSYQSTGAIPGLEILTTSVAGGTIGVAANLGEFGRGRGISDLIIIPWDATFEGARYVELGAGALGIVLLMALPLMIFVPRRRAAAIVVVAVAVAYLAWAFTAQYLRYALPLIALVCALCGAGGARLLTSPLTTGGLRGATAAIIASSLLLSPVLFVPTWFSQAPVGLLTGSIGRDDFLALRVGGYRVLAGLERLIPPGTQVGWIGRGDAAEIHGVARIIGVRPETWPDDPAGILAELDGREIDYLIWERNSTAADIWRTSALDVDFLSRYTNVLDAADNVLLLEVLDVPADRWALATDDLLSDPTMTGDAWSGTGEQRPGGGVELPPVGLIEQTIDVVPGRAYSFLATIACETPDARPRLVLDWFDDHEKMLSITSGQVVPGTEGSEQFLWAVAPPRARHVDVRVIGADEAACLVIRASVHGYPLPGSLPTAIGS
jgi:hypothetical protein